MVKDSSEVMSSFLKNIQASGKKEPVGEQPTGSSLAVSTPADTSLSEKLRERVEQMRKDKAAEEQKIEFTNADETWLAGLIIGGKDRPNRFGGKTRDVNGVWHDMVFYFDKGICKVESDLFLDPFYIVINHSDVQDVRGYVFLVSEFYTMLRILNVFDGRICLTPVN